MSATEYLSFNNTGTGTHSLPLQFFIKSTRAFLIENIISLKKQTLSNKEDWSTLHTSCYLLNIRRTMYNFYLQQLKYFDKKNGNSRPTVINDNIISKNLKNMIKRVTFIFYVNNKEPILFFFYQTLTGY